MKRSRLTVVLTLVFLLPLSGCASWKQLPSVSETRYTIDFQHFEIIASRPLDQRPEFQEFHLAAAMPPTPDGAKKRMWLLITRITPNSPHPVILAIELNRMLSPKRAFINDGFIANGTPTGSYLKLQPSDVSRALDHVNRAIAKRNAQRQLAIK